MMHDVPRNEAFRKAIAEAVQSDEDFVLEIGTGSGLLALMAADSGCQHVFTVEGDRPVADAAREVIEANGRREHVTVLSKLSTEVCVGWSADVPCPADVLVAEIFDTQLIGEGVLPSFIDAHRRLLSAGARVVPHRGVVFAAGFRSDHLRALDTLEGEAYAAVTGRGRAPRGPGLAPVFQVQAASLIENGLLSLVTQPEEVLRLDFASPETLVPEPTTLTRLRVTSDGRLDGVLMWWRLDMNPAGDITITTCPGGGPGGGPPATSQPVRAHWQQGAAVFRDVAHHSCGDVVELRTAVKGWDLHFGLVGDGGADPLGAPSAADPWSFPATSRPRLLQLSDPNRLAWMAEQVRVAYAARTVDGPILCLTEGCVGALAALGLADEVIVLAASDAGARALQSLLGDRATVMGFEECGLPRAAEACLGTRGPSVVLCEPHESTFSALGTTWGLEEVAMAQERLRTLQRESGLLGHGPAVLPAVRLVGRALECEEFRRRRVPVDRVEGYDLRPFSERAPLWRAHDVKRSSLAGWSPKWLSERVECAIRWGEAAAEGGDVVARLDGRFTGAGHVHAVAFWLEDHAVLDPLRLPAVGVLTPSTVHAACPGEAFACTFSGSCPSELRCSFSPLPG